MGSQPEVGVGGFMTGSGVDCGTAFMDPPFPHQYFILVECWVVNLISLITTCGDALEVPNGFMRIKTIYGVVGQFSGVKYHIGKPNVKLKILSVSIKRVPAILGVGKRNGN